MIRPVQWSVTVCRDDKVSVSRQHESIYRAVEPTLEKEKLVKMIKIIKYTIQAGQMIMSGFINAILLKWSII